jgi:CubicO group peptidase (beta-lactamase class C family)
LKDRDKPKFRKDVQEVMGESNISEHMPNHINTRFAIASGCNIFTTITILKLVEMGKLSLDHSVTDCLPYFL